MNHVAMQKGSTQNQNQSRACATFCNIRLKGSPAAASTVSLRLRQNREEGNAVRFKVAC